MSVKTKIFLYYRYW